MKKQKQNIEVNLDETKITDKKIKKSLTSQEIVSSDENKNILHVEKSELNIDEAIVEERLKEAAQSQSPKKKRRSQIINTLFLLVNIILMVFIVRSFLNSLGEDASSMPEKIREQGSKLWWLFGGVLFYILFIVMETCIFSALMKGTTGKRRPYLSYRVAIIGKYYDNITPFSVGGQPFQIVTLAQSGLSAGISTSLPVIKLIIYNIVYSLFIAISFIFGMPVVAGIYTGLGKFLIILLIAVAIVGLVFTALTGLLFILIGNGKIIGRGATRWIVKIGYSLRIVKDYRKTYNKIMMQVREYQNSMDFLRKNKIVMLKCVLYSLVEVFAYFAIPVVCIYAFSTSMEVTWTLFFITMTQFMICQMAAVIIPLPGGTGMMEIGFILVFGVVNILGNNVFMALLAFRIISYYLLILHGFIQAIIDSVVKSIRLKRQQQPE